MTSNKINEEVCMHYTHAPLDETVRFVAGSYQIDSENILEYKGRRVLYLMGCTDQICGCCGSCDPIRFISVPGYIKSWKARNNDEGLPVTDIEVVTDEKERLEIKKTLQQEHALLSVEFW